MNHFGGIAISRRTIVVVLGVGGLLVVIAAVVFGYQAAKARQSLQLAATQAQELQRQVSAGDVAAAGATLERLQSSTSAARARTAGPLWDTGRYIPFFGRSVEATQTISQVLDEVANDGLYSVVDVAGSVDSRVFSPQSRRVDVDAIRELAPALDAADRSLSAGRRDLAGIGAGDLVGPLQQSVRDLKAKIGSAQSAASSGAIAARLMPSMLGAGGARRYLLVVQNNAELRSTGGLPGAFAVLEADDGELELTDQGAGSEFGYFPEPVVELTKDEIGVYSELMATFWSDANFTPDFPRAAQIMRTMYEDRFGESLDGVVSIDPVALSYLLKATGPVELADGTQLTADNAVDQLLNGVYLQFPDDNKAQDAYFQDVAERVFDAVSLGKGHPRDLLRQLSKGAAEHRLLVWSNDQQEQELLAGTRIAGVLPGDSGPVPHVGIYLNDSTATKLEYYLDHTTTMHTESCSPEGVQTIDTTTVLTSTVPRGAKGLPPSVLGPSKGARKGAMQLNVRVYAPFGGEINEVTVNDELQTVQSARHHQRDVTIVPVTLAPGQTVTVRTILLTGEQQRTDPILSVTPTVSATKNGIAIASACHRPE